MVGSSRTDRWHGSASSHQRFHDVGCDAYWLIEDPEHPYFDLEPQDALDELSSASIRYRIADGPGAGQRTLTLRRPSLA